MEWCLLAESAMSRYLLLSLLVLGACMPAEEDPDANDHDPDDFEVENDPKADGVSIVFDQNNVMTDELFEHAGAMTVDDVQAFFEDSPYGNRSWLASATIDGVSAAQAVVDAAQANGVHPLVLIARMQVESSLVSKTVRPSQRLVDRALGCGCPDGGGCSSSFKGLPKQLECGAITLRKWYDASVDGSGQWRKGVTKSTLDPRRVTPANHATATHYAYTPWVLVGSGGTWLAWNITRKYVKYAERNGLATPPLGGGTQQ
jgi:hypothetical protein